MILVNTNVKKNLIGFITGITNGMFGSGGGTIIVPALKNLLDIKTHKAHATAIAVTLPLTIVSLTIYLFKLEEKLDLLNVLYVSIGGVLGGYIGAKILNKIKSKWLNKIFGIFILVMAVKMLL